MKKTNRGWLPAYCQPDAFLPKVPETRVLFSRRPFLFQDFLGKAMAFLQSGTARKMGFVYRPESALPCKWRCADESLFGVDLCLYAYTGQYPFDKGAIGGMYNEASLGAAAHHGGINMDFGGSHVGYVPGEGGGRFGAIWRPLHQEYSTDCGYLMGVIEPFRKVYDDACRNILVYDPVGERLVVSIPNEFLHPDWSSHHIKLLVDLEAMTAETVDYQDDLPHTHTLVGRSLFYLHPGFIACLSPAQAQAFHTPRPTPMGRALTHQFFNIFDATASLDEAGQPKQKLLPYMKHIVSAAHSPEGLKAAIINTSLNHNALTDAVRSQAFLPYDFVSFTGIFIDLYDDDLQSYVNLFQPLGLTIKPKGCQREVEMTTEEIHHVLGKLPLAPPMLPLEDVLGFSEPEIPLEKFTYQPGYFTRP
ncbi:MAG: hypothetical protein HY910_13895 [Desulfarculus sp.]|nr:hypothetical protein [Desulfarculus sp.]